MQHLEILCRADRAHLMPGMPVGGDRFDGNTVLLCPGAKRGIDKPGAARNERRNAMLTAHGGNPGRFGWRQKVCAAATDKRVHRYSVTSSKLATHVLCVRILSMAQNVQRLDT